MVRANKNKSGEQGLSGESQTKIHIGPPKLTRFERAKIVGARSLQLSIGAPLLIEPPEGATSSIDLALAELKLKVLPLTVRRSLPNGEYQDIPVQWLQV